MSFDLSAIVYPFDSKEHRAAVTARLREIMAFVESKGVEYDGRDRVTQSILSHLQFAPMPLVDLAGMYMAHMKECSLDIAWAAIHKVKNDDHLARRQAEIAASGNPLRHLPPDSTTKDIHFEVDRNLELVEVALEYAERWQLPELKRLLLMVKLRPFEWGLIVARHPKFATRGVYVTSLENPALDYVDILPLRGDGTKYVKAMFEQHDKAMLTERRHNYYLYTALQNLRTVK